MTAPAQRNEVTPMAYGPPQTVYTSQTPADSFTTTGGASRGADVIFAVAGRVTALRVYRTAGGPAEVRVLKLWNSAGAQIGSANTDDTAGPGWKTAPLSPPIDVAAGETVRVSYAQATTENVPRTLGSPGAITNGDLTIPAGQYAGTPASSRPTSSSGTWWFLDVIFEAGTAPPPIIPPFTDPYGPGVADLLTGSHRQDITAELVDDEGSLPLDILDGSLRFDATTVPRVQLQLSVPVPTTQATLDRFDPRAGARIRIRAGYIYGTGAMDTADVADLLLTYRATQRPSDTVALRATSSEQRVMERGVDAAMAGAAAVATGIAIEALILDRYPEAVIDIGSLGTSVAAAWTIDPGDNPWQTVEALADAAGLEAFDDGLGTIHIDDQPRIAATPHLELTVGEDGTVESSSTDINRDQFANGVALVHKWTPAGGSETVVTGRAFAAGGAFLWGGAPGRCLYTETRSTEITQAAADAAAYQILYRALGAGHGVSVDAVSAWWARPGMTVDVQLPLGDVMRQLVTTVTFDLVAGRMTLTTREPDDPDIATTPPGG